MIRAPSPDSADLVCVLEVDRLRTSDAADPGPAG
jgi:hypothetical protein